MNCLGALRRTRYEAYGNTAAGAVPTGLGFTGHVNDADTGLVYMQQRYYDPIAARFLSVDPIVTDEKAEHFNRYEYANNNPYRYVDPDGRDPWFKEDSAQTMPVITITGARPMPTINPPAPSLQNVDIRSAGLLVRPMIPFALLLTPSQLGAPACEMPGGPSCGMMSQSASGGSGGKAKPGRAQRPEGTPPGTKPVDQDKRLDRGKIHEIKDQLGAGATDWVGIDAEGNIWTNEGGQGANQGPYTDYVN